MIYKNVELFNVEETEIFDDHSITMLRIPATVRDQLNSRARTIAAGCATGVEIRFVITGEKAVVKLFVSDIKANDFCPLVLYYGAIQSGWLWLDPQNLNCGLNEIVIKRPENFEEFERLARTYHHPFSPCVMRVRLSSGNSIKFVGVEGNVRPPQVTEEPKEKILFYGSSITHGSLSAMPDTTFVSIIASKTGYDAINLGFAGSCYIEKAMSDYIASRDDYRFAVVELGTNAFGEIDDNEFAQRCMYLIRTYKRNHPDKKLYVIDCFSVKPRYDICRKIVFDCVKEIDSPTIIYVCGKNLLENENSIAADFTHPTVEGQRKIAENLRTLFG